MLAIIAPALAKAISEAPHRRGSHGNIPL